MWSPFEFWRATPHELFASLDGYLEKTGQKKETGMTQDRLAELMRNFPD